MQIWFKKFFLCNLINSFETLNKKIKLVKQESIKTLLVPAKENAKYAIAVDQDTDLNDIVILN